MCRTAHPRKRISTVVSVKGRKFCQVAGPGGYWSRSFVITAWSNPVSSVRDSALASNPDFSRWRLGVPAEDIFKVCPQNFADAPCLRHRAPRGKRRSGVEHLRDRANTGVPQVLPDRIEGSGNTLFPIPSPIPPERGDVRTEQRAPDCSLVIGTVSAVNVPNGVGTKIRVPWGQCPKTQRGLNWFRTTSSTLQASGSGSKGKGRLRAKIWLGRTAASRTSPLTQS